MKFTASHEWILLDGKTGTVGITNKAQQELGDVVHVELPAVGKVVKAGDEIAVLESTKAAADIYSPVSGEIVEINTQLIDQCELINRDPEASGWLFKIRCSKPDELEKLLNQKDYIALIN